MALGDPCQRICRPHRSHDPQVENSWLSRHWHSLFIASLSPLLPYLSSDLGLLRCFLIACIKCRLWPITEAKVSTCRGFFGAGIRRKSESGPQFPLFVSMSLVQISAGQIEQASSSRGAQMASSSRDQPTSFSVLSGSAGTGLLSH